MGKKSGKISELIAGHHGRDLDPHYLGYFDCFNRGLYFEAHEVLEHLWLADRKGANHAFFKGLIQLAGAYVHLQKNRLRPSSALFKLAQTNLSKYPAIHEHLDVAKTLNLIESWLHELEAHGYSINPLASREPPMIELIAREQRN